MRDLTDVRIRRGLMVLAAVLLCLAVAGPVHAKEEKVNFIPGTDISSWYWQRQIDEEVTTPDGVTLPPPVPPASQRVRLPNPQRPDTLPVGLSQGETQQVSAIKFDLLERGVVEGSEVKKLDLYIEESQDRNENPQLRPEIAKIQACLLLDFLPQGESEKWEDAPKHSENDCVPGTRDAPPSAPAVWTFELTEIAEVWGTNPFDNNGVMLMPVVEPGATWQVNLKVPRKEAPAEEGDQYELTKNRAFITIDYIPGEPLEIPEVPAPAAPAPASSGTTSGTTTFPPSGSPVIGPSTDLAGGGDIPGAAEAAPPAPAPTEQAGFLVPQEQGPRMPAYVWLVIPLGLLALAAVRSVVLEPVGGPRPDGVIAAIRRRNAEHRGGTTAGGQELLSRMSGGIKRGFGGLGAGFSSLTRKLRRKT